MGNKPANILIGGEVSKGPLVEQELDLSKLKKVMETYG
jgi:hypothetical protein